MKGGLDEHRKPEVLSYEIDPTLLGIMSRRYVSTYICESVEGPRCGGKHPAPLHQHVIQGKALDAATGLLDHQQAAKANICGS